MKQGRKTKFKADYPADFVFDYKDPVSLARFVTDGGKIASSRISKLSYPQQQRLARAVKRARNLALLPIGSEAHSSFGRPAQISAKPFEL